MKLILITTFCFIFLSFNGQSNQIKNDKKDQSKHLNEINEVSINNMKIKIQKKIYLEYVQFSKNEMDSIINYVTNGFFQRKNSFEQCGVKCCSSSHQHENFNEKDEQLILFEIHSIIYEKMKKK